MSLWDADRPVPCPCPCTRTIRTQECSRRWGPLLVWHIDVTAFPYRGSGLRKSLTPVPSVASERRESVGRRHSRREVVGLQYEVLRTLLRTNSEPREVRTRLEAP